MLHFFTDSLAGSLVANISGDTQTLSCIPNVIGIWQEVCYDVCTTPLLGDLTLEFLAENVEAGIDNVLLSEYMCPGT